MEQEKESRIKGFVIQPRLLIDNFIDKALFNYFLEIANFEPNERCGRGECIVSLHSLAEVSRWSYGSIRGSIHRLKDDGLITVETLSQKRGTRILIIDYSSYQNLDFYKKINKQDNKPLTNQEQTINKQDNKQNDNKKPHDYKENKGLENSINKQGNKPLTNQEQTINKQINNTLTALITSLNNINNIKTLKDFLATANVKNLNLSSREDIEIFVDFAEKINPIQANRKIVYQYFNCIRLTRGTCRISANILANVWEKFKKYDVNQLHYAMMKHCIDHDDKNEKYTLGILRNTDVHEARRKLISIMNKNPREEVTNAISSKGNDQDTKYEFGF